MEVGTTHVIIEKTGGVDVLQFKIDRPVSEIHVDEKAYVKPES